MVKPLADYLIDLICDGPSADTVETRSGPDDEVLEAVIDDDGAASFILWAQDEDNPTVDYEAYLVTVKKA